MFCDQNVVDCQVMVCAELGYENALYLTIDLT